MGSDQFLSAKGGDSDEDEEEYKDAVEEEINHFLLDIN